MDPLRTNGSQPKQPAYMVNVGYRRYNVYDSNRKQTSYVLYPGSHSNRFFPANADGLLNV